METELTLSLGEVQLRPLQIADAQPLLNKLNPEIWAGLTVPFPATEAQMSAHLQDLLVEPHTISLAVEYRGELVGKTGYYDLDLPVKTDVGSTIYAPEVWGTQVNPICKFLLMRHAFETWQLKRVGIRCDTRNKRSHAAIKKLGATYEGVLRNFRSSADGSIVDVDYFSIIDREWPQVKARLAERIGLTT